MNDLIPFPIAALVLVFYALTRPSVIECPIGWVAEGARLDGSSRCVRASTVPDTQATSCGGGGACSGVVEPEPYYPVRLYCTSGLVPLVVDHRSIGCRRVTGRDLRAER